MQTFRLKVELVRFLLRKLHDLVFDRRAVAWTDRLDLSGIHRRTVHVFAYDVVGLRRRVGDVARYLRLRDLLGAETEWRRLGVSRLHLEARPVDGAPVETRRSASLQAASTQTERLQRFAQQHRGRFA